MSDDEYSQDQISHKKRRNAYSCDNCKKRKIKCDSATRPGNICSSCLAFKTECTHISARKKRGPPKGYVKTAATNLLIDKHENSLPRGQKTMPSIVSSILSTVKPYEPPSDTTAVKKLLINLAEHITELEQEISDLRNQLQQQIGLLTPSKSQSTANLSFKPLPEISPSAPTGSYLDSDIQAFEALTELLGKVSIENKYRHFGGSSSIMLVKSTIDIKNEYAEDDSGHSSIEFAPSEAQENIDNYKRPAFWTIHPWQILPADESPPFIFPDPDLIDSLVSLYFTHINVYFPILHKPSFLRSIAQNLHREDRHFGALILARITAIEQSVGWKWIRQIQPVSRTFTTPPCIYEIQLYGVYVFFMQATSTAESCWVLIAIGVRYAQDVGAHRKKDGLKPTLESELWIRAFWMLYTMDIYISVVLGRPRSINTEDFDVDLPCICDDEYWENPDDPESAFQQPPGKPSSALYFICFIKLMDILGLVMRTIYAIRRSDMWAASRMNAMQWNEKIVAELDSSLNKWVDEIPEHLRWDPNKENTEHFHQSVALYTTYYWVQIQIHRQFIARPGEAPLISFPSLAICANASRSTCRIMEIQRRRNIGLFPMPSVIMALFCSSLILLVNVWRGRRLKGSTSTSALEKELADVYQCLNLLGLYEKRWQEAGTFCDILRQIISVSRFHHDQRPSELRSTKRSRKTIDTAESTNGDSYVVDTSGIEHHDERHRVSAATVDSGQYNPGTSTPWMELPSSQGLQSAVPLEGAYFQSYNNFFTLPTHTHELGSLPIYESFAAWPMNDQSLSQTQQFWTSPSPISHVPMPMDIAIQSQPQSIASLSSNLNTSSIIPEFTFSSQSLIPPDSYSHGLMFEGITSGVIPDVIHTNSASATASSHDPGMFPNQNEMQEDDHEFTRTSMRYCKV
ncbi:hypothetical protein BT96DRAFT_1018250 [Gymnopus androsaceus JB14]|uniref:Zn(2)-C6 fungal-type domain-containing protein n=1 Tax=Gymnopus androsaceus JB14 TaxID=1447944 RepID=A0A6A4HTM1_9AGAR|nr:hypothetical protein BT96DRAFT_1018250 [Gymnopus androsaceus JB14]